MDRKEENKHDKEGGKQVGLMRRVESANDKKVEKQV